MKCYLEHQLGAVALAVVMRGPVLAYLALLASHNEQLI
jgi:hypothetical protein